jgi:hypothetical protein
MAVRRTKDFKILNDTLSPYEHELVGLDQEAWIVDDTNYCLSDGQGSLGLFQTNGREVAMGHYFFKVRGRAALVLAKEMLEFIFTRTPIKMITGLTPEDKPGAKWMSRQLGFKSHGLVDTEVGECEIFILSKGTTNG